MELGSRCKGFRVAAKPCGALQDTDYAVRICMCWQLPLLACALGREAAAEKLLPEALEVGGRLMQQDSQTDGPKLACNTC